MNRISRTNGRRVNLVALGLGALFAGDCSFGQGRQSPNIPFPTAPVPFTPEKPRSKPKLVTPPRLPMGPGDILVEGVIQGVSFVHHDFKMLATSFTLPDGSRSLITSPKLKSVSFEGLQFVAAAPFPADGKTPRWTPVGSLWPTYRVAVVGQDVGAGKTLNARLIELGGQGMIISSNVRSSHNPTKTIFYGGAREHVAAAGLRVQQVFGFKAIQSRAGQDGARDEHAQGTALDFMVGSNTKMGDDIAAFFEASAGLLNVKYIQWKGALVYPGSRTEWKGMALGQESTRVAGQVPHVHVSFVEHPLLPGPYLTDALIGQVVIRPGKPSGRRGRRR